MSSAVEKLVKKLRAAADAYYNGGTAVMGDNAYDAAVEELRAMDPEHPFLQEVGAPPPSVGAVQLPHAMPSLDKIKPGEDRLTRFLKGGVGTGFVISEKLDGLSALWLPATKKLYLRGDGITGQDISHLVGRGIQGLRGGATRAVVRGELLLPRSAGEQLARAWVNGVIHRKDPNPDDVAKLRFVAYELLVPAGLTRVEQFRQLFTAGYEVSWNRSYPELTEDELIAVLQDRRANSRYDTDGIVVGLNTPPKSESTATKARNPKDCVAFKMPLADQSAETTITEVIWGTSSQGYLIPKLQFDPVVIGSATIQFCTAHNAKTVVENGLAPGARIVVRRSGDVIPKLDRVIRPAASPSLPAAGTYEWDETQTHIRVVSAGKELAIAQLGHFLKALEIPGSGPATAAALIEGGILGPKALWDTTPEKLSEILGPKTGASLWSNLRSALEEASEKTLMIASSQMPRGVGDTKLTSLFSLNPNPAEWRRLGAAPGWTAHSLQAFWPDLEGYEAWRRKELGWIPYPKMGRAAVSGTVSGTATTSGSKGVLCMTGFRDKALEGAAIAAGWTISPSMTAKVTLLLVPDGDLKESEKVKAARDKGVRILKRGDFIPQK